MLSIGVEIFAMGTVTSLCIILIKDMNVDYQSVNAQKVLIGTSGFTNNLLSSISRLDSVKDNEGRGALPRAVRLHQISGAQSTSLSSYPWMN